MKYYDVFGESGYDSAFLTTYAFSAQAFEDVPFPRLRGAGCRNISVLADQRMVNTSFEEFGPPRFAGTLYHVVKISVPGAFHPKITLLSGAEKGRLLIGSANLTGLGLGGNRELIADIPYTAERPEYLHIFGQALRYIAGRVPSDDPWFPSALERAFRQSRWLQTAYLDETSENLEDLKLIIDRPDDAILGQMVEAIGGDPIERLIVISPFWDEGLEGLARLRVALGNPETDLLVQPSAGQFPVESVTRHDKLRLFNAAVDGSSRFVHAKLFLALGATWDHVISGSMNCSFPALLGPEASKGNAEAGVYKRVTRGAALTTLGLEEYEDHPLQFSDLPPKDQRATALSSPPAPADAGTFELHARRLTWRPSVHGAFDAREIRLLDRDESETGQVLEIGAASGKNWEIDPDMPRPRLAVVVATDGTRSAPSFVIDLDVLASSTRPVQRGRKRRIIDELEELEQEDLTILEALNELEMLDDSSQNEISAQSKPHAKETSTDTEKKDHKVLPYEAFVQARNRALEQNQHRPHWVAGRGETAASVINACLNRLVGLVSEDFSETDERALMQDASTDLRTTEPSQDDENTAESHDHSVTKQEKSAQRARAKATARKFLEAVQSFEKRTASLKEKRITTAELVRLRALLQVVMASAVPISGASRAHQVLTLNSKDGTEWPRLIGRLLLQHFGTIRALQLLDVEADEAEHTRVLDYLATARFAARAAVKGASASPALAPIQRKLKEIAADIDTQVKAISKGNDSDSASLAGLEEKLETRFGYLFS
ncbi:hypothetical protein [Shimia biformata]|uniref:hypothetical protein n=1 Tax=Shimia biformata TaxID=1294299 RepID=UPI001951B5B6|nr:hypothetical protein [Shimia biformata]